MNPSNEGHEPLALSEHGAAPGPWWHLAFAASSAVAFLLAWGMLGGYLVNPVNYTIVPAPRGDAWPWFAVAIPMLGVLVVRGGRQRAILPGTLLLTASVALAYAWHTGAAMSFAFVGILIVILSGFADRLAVPPPANDRGERSGAPSRTAPWLLALAVVGVTVWHTATQAEFWRHFLLGYADWGFFTTELEYCLPYHDVAARFHDTRMGYHSIPLFYALAPVYAVFRSPLFLMAVGPLALNLAAFAFYGLARERSQSRWAGLLAGLAWLALPSLSRLPYANTYGFQSIYLATPFIAGAVTMGLRGKWKSAHLCLAAAMLCEETVCGVAAGWGVYVALFTERRRTGVAIVTIAAIYLLLCTQVIIPSFAQAETYTRLKLFGELTPSSVAERLMRPRVGLYLLALTAPLAVWIVRAPRLLIAAAPTLMLIALMRDHDYLNIKYWHQTSVLPVLMAAAVCGATRGTAAAGRRGAPWCLAAMLTCVLLLQQALGFAPLTRAMELFQRNADMHRPDPRWPVVQALQQEIPPDCTVLATERLAAHFTTYRAIYAGVAPTPTDYILVDTNDRWDRSGLIERAEQWVIEGRYLARNAGAGILVLKRVLPESPTIVE